MKTSKIVTRVFWNSLWIGVAIAITACRSTPNTAESAIRPSNYSVFIQDPFNRPSTYPPVPVSHAYRDFYQPVATWSGRLILPQRSQRQAEDFVWFEIQNAALGYQNQIGQWAKLTWSDRPEVQDYVELVTSDIQFTVAARDSQHQGNVHPTRLDGWTEAKPLESLAGARPADDVVVMLSEPEVAVAADGQLVLKVSDAPVQMTGRWQGLVKILEPIAENPVPNDSEIADHPSAQWFQVRHFDRTTQQFDGSTESVIFPRGVLTRDGIQRFTTNAIQNSPLNQKGWYIYGDRTQNGTFVVQAVEPRYLMQLQPDEAILKTQAGVDYIAQENWANTPQRKGTAQSVLLVPGGVESDEVAIASWRNLAASRQRAIVLHTFGGIGGEKAETRTLGTTTGHFSYGIVDVIVDPLTDQPRFWITHYQVYAHGPDGIVSGAVHWADYSGNLQRGWLGTRPMSEVIIDFDVVTQAYDFGGIKLSPLDTFIRQLQIMTARYRTGDGTGASIVTPATSCVQDSNQALYATIKSVEYQVSQNENIQAWLAANPQHPETLRFRRLVQLGQQLEAQLAPLGIVRSDWASNVENLSGITTQPHWTSRSQITTALASWRTLLPRRAHDEVSTLMLTEGANLWVLRTNQIGGYDPAISPRAPTTLLGF